MRAPGLLVVALHGLFTVGCAEPRNEAPPAVSTQPQELTQRKPVRKPRPAPTRASQSPYNQDIRKATTSTNLTKADLAWHAVNTYGWDCEEVLNRDQQAGNFFVITCANGTKLRVYPRRGKHPRITNINGNYS